MSQHSSMRRCSSATRWATGSPREPLLLSPPPPPCVFLGGLSCFAWWAGKDRCGISAAREAGISTVFLGQASCQEGGNDAHRVMPSSSSFSSPSQVHSLLLRIRDALLSPPPLRYTPCSRALTRPVVQRLRSWRSGEHGARRSRSRWPTSWKLLQRRHASEL